MQKVICELVLPEKTDKELLLFENKPFLKKRLKTTQMTPQQKLFSLKLKSARLFSKIESMLFVRDTTALKFGKIQIQILLLEKEIIRTAKNPLEED